MCCKFALDVATATRSHDASKHFKASPDICQQTRQSFRQRCHWDTTIHVNHPQSLPFYAEANTYSVVISHHAMRRANKVRLRNNITLLLRQTRNRLWKERRRLTVSCCIRMEALTTAGAANQTLSSNVCTVFAERHKVQLANQMLPAQWLITGTVSQDRTD